VPPSILLSGITQTSRQNLSHTFAIEPSDMEQHLQAIVTVLSLVNPLICGVMFAQIEAGQSRAIRITDATKAALAVLVILLVAALAGARVLQIFGVSLDAFSIAGGGVLTWIWILDVAR
jgi:multiple antibiotic resistance protein